MHEEEVRDAKYLKVRVQGNEFKSNIELGIKHDEGDQILFSNHFTKDMNLWQITKKAIELLDLVCDLKMKHDWELRFMGISKHGVRFFFDYVPSFTAYTQTSVGWSEKEAEDAENSEMFWMND